ncbi:hypothetical protein [Rhizobium herbae]|uniref:DUF982 domain-containing protein n=1 Tax=Rhizobium herbae TaxID=508661 RepID=A0ABS4EG61_9HYPH|nr:hypothetical protein [Rhizobium herbae]MBP1856928.1 hypothetical protein [Rhizobium herbae]
MSTISISQGRLLPITAARPAEYMPAETALASLIARVCAVRVLREHHIWEAVRILPHVAGLPEEMKQSPEFRRLMEREAFAAALRLIAQSCDRACAFRGLDPCGDHWVATLSVGTGLAENPRRERVKAQHRDPPAAMLIALLGSAAGKGKPFARRRRTTAATQKEMQND